MAIHQSAARLRTSASLLAVILMSVLLVPNAGAEPAGRIVILGDSITAGYGVDRAESYPSLLQRKIDQTGLPYKVINAGVSGDTTGDGLRRLDRVLASGADILIIALGANDGLRRIPPTVTAGNLTTIIKRAKAQIPNVKIILAGMQMPQEMGADFTAAFEALFAKVAKENGVELIPFLLKDVGGISRMNLPDRIHPNPQGHTRISETVWSTLDPILRKKYPTPR
jgi:acyl-CoA thioesterase-1